MNLMLSLGLVLIVGFCWAQESLMREKMRNSPIMQIKKSVDKKLCSDDNYSEEVIKKIEDCDQFDPHYKIDV